MRNRAEQQDRIEQRRDMVAQIAARGVRDTRVLEAMLRVPRERFLPASMREHAYDDSPLPIAEGQTLSQPYIVALMAEVATLRPGERVLEIGTGSGYAAAVLCAMGIEVFTVERLARLGEDARAALEKHGFGGIQVCIGDGTLGWPEQAPFDAIIATAGGSQVPENWKGQLKPGGRLIMPIGDTPRQQRLIRVTRVGDQRFEQQDLEAVRFVPLIGEQGWSEAQAESSRPRSPAAARAPAEDDAALVADIAAAVEPLPEIDDPAFARCIDRFADHRVVLLGEASHGTSEFYRARAALTRRLIERHGFNLVAVEADWPDAEVMDRYVRHRPALDGPDPPFQRFPTWMWRNREVQDFTRWLKAHNAGLTSDRRVGFRGLDLYNLSASIRAVLDYLEEVDPHAARAARQRYACLAPWRNTPAAYGRAVLSEPEKACEEAVIAQLRALLEKQLEYVNGDQDRYFDATQNARLVASAERYYRSLYHGAAESWNLRDRHMFETLENLLAERGGDSKAVVWAHNSHIGDASATDMGRQRGELNLGQLCRERFGEQAALVGLSTHAGTVAAADDWDGPMRIKTVRPVRQDSHEHLALGTSLPRFLLDLRSGVLNEALRRRLDQPRRERFIGVIYRPETELQSHYMKASLASQFDAWLWFRDSQAVSPLVAGSGGAEDDTYPFGT
ncbi:protein-L-isoaspartate O-methyltransferase [Alcanivorax sp. N3-2A]|nr:protein-L-isoaspartate O-methyltransferase [Alcanivorax sp. N3-2A]